MQLEDVPKLYSAKAQGIEMFKKPLSFVERFFNLRKNGGEKNGRWR
jgi:hypothetical protein